MTDRLPPGNRGIFVPTVNFSQAQSRESKDFWKIFPYTIYPCSISTRQYQLLPIRLLYKDFWHTYSVCGERKTFKCMLHK